MDHEGLRVLTREVSRLQRQAQRLAEQGRVFSAAECSELAALTERELSRQRLRAYHAEGGNDG